MTSTIHLSQHGMLYTDGFYTRFESFCDGIIGFKCQEEAVKFVHYMRTRIATRAVHECAAHDSFVGVSHSVKMESAHRPFAELPPGLTGPKSEYASVAKSAY